MFHVKQKGQNCFGPNYLYEIGLKRRRHAPRPRFAPPAERAFVRQSESAPRDPLIPVIIITGISDSFKIKHLAVYEAREPRQSLHLVFAMVRGWSPSGHGPLAGGRGPGSRGPKSIGAGPARAPFPSLRTGRSRHVLSEAVGKEGSRLASLLRALSHHTMQVARFTNSWRNSPLVTQKRPGVWAPGQYVTSQGSYIRDNCSRNASQLTLS